MISRLLQEPSKRYTDADPYEVSEYVNQHIGNHRLILNGDRESSATLHHRKAGGIDLCRLSYVALCLAINQRPPVFPFTHIRM